MREVHIRRTCASVYTGTSKQTQDNQMAVCVVDAVALFFYDTDNRLLIGHIFNYRWDFSCRPKKLFVQVDQKYRQRKQPLEWACKGIWEVRAPCQAASFQG